jgi:hypothetical protein
LTFGATSSFAADSCLMFKRTLRAQTSHNLVASLVFVGLAMWLVLYTP